MGGAMSQIHESVTHQIIDGVTNLEDELNPVEKRRKVFGFISSETKLNIQAQMKQLIAKMDNMERRHYE